jgi:hypothetical protein
VIGVISEDWLVVSALGSSGGRCCHRRVHNRPVALYEQVGRGHPEGCGANRAARAAPDRRLGPRGGTRAPRLTLKRGETNVTQDHVAGEIRIENIGASAAYDIEIETSWSTPVIAGPMVPGSKQDVTPTISKSEWHYRSDYDPIIKGFRFRDT